MVVKHSILISKNNTNVKFIVTDVLTNRLFNVKSICGYNPIVHSTLNYDDIWRHYHIKLPLKLLLKKL